LKDAAGFSFEPDSTHDVPFDLLINASFLPDWMSAGAVVFRDDRRNESAFMFLHEIYKHTAR